MRLRNLWCGKTEKQNQRILELMHAELFRFFYSRPNCLRCYLKCKKQTGSWDKWIDRQLCRNSVGVENIVRNGLGRAMSADSLDLNDASCMTLFFIVQLDMGFFLQPISCSMFGLFFQQKLKSNFHTCKLSPEVTLNLPLCWAFDWQLAQIMLKG